MGVQIDLPMILVFSDTLPLLFFITSYTLSYIWWELFPVFFSGCKGPLSPSFFLGTNGAGTPGKRGSLLAFCHLQSLAASLFD